MDPTGKSGKYAVTSFIKDDTKITISESQETIRMVSPEHPEDQSTPLLVTAAQEDGTYSSRIQRSWDHYYVEDLDNLSLEDSVSQSSLRANHGSQYENLAEYVQTLAAKQARCDASIRKLEKSTRNFVSFAIPIFIVMLLLFFFYVIDAKSKKP